MVCVGCHLPQGQGQEGLAPPLAGSEWVQGPEQRLIRIVLHGVGGPITVNGTEYNMDMPGIGAAFSDEQIAQVLSYIRRDFGNEAPVVDTATVTSVRAATKDRGATWTAVELLNIH
jgi:mono/diheme cytochrome c family protein